jgi:predicted nucleic acid-binding protein
MYLVDTNVISIGVPARAPMHASLARWMDEQSERLFLSVVTIAEIDEGIAKARRLGAIKKAAQLGEWLDVVLHLYGNRILPVDIAVARIVGSLSDHARGVGQAPGLPDIIIAATSRAHGLTVLTRNIRHFVPLGARVHDPFDSLPDPAAGLIVHDQQS